jgi:hypothetical protein
MRRARKAILDAELSGDKVALGRLLSQDFRTRRPDDQILNKAQLLGEMDRGLFEGLKVPDRSKVSVVVDDPRPLRNLGLMSRVKISYSDGGRMITEVRRDLTLFSKEGNQLVATVNRWTRE